MSCSQAKRKKSNLTPQELLCVLYLLILDEPGDKIVFKAIELADLRTKGSLKAKCEYFDFEKVYRIIIKDNPFEGRAISVPAAGSLILNYLKKLREQQSLNIQEFITCLYMAILRKPRRQYCFMLKSLTSLKRRGKMKLDVKYFGAEQTFVISARRDPVEGRIIEPGEAVLTAMSGANGNGEQ